MSAQEPIVYVVPIIDTEGPTKGREDMFDNWSSLGEAMSVLTTETRNRFRDSFGSPLKYSWDILDWAGFSIDDPEFKRRGHVTELHGIWNFYRKNILADSRIENTGDGIYWHYHHPPKDGSWGWNDDWNDSTWHEYIVAKRMLDFGFFPAMYRAGKYVENNASSHWLERWIPFDFSSIAPVKREFCDWSRVQAGWQPYHPSVDDYQRPGTMKRLIARSLPVAAKGGSGNLQEKEVEKAFREAREKGLALFSFHSHDYYKSIFDDFAAACGMVDKMSRSFNIPWKAANALEAIRNYIEPSSVDLSLSIKQCGLKARIISSHPIFGEMPFVALEYEDGEVMRIDVRSEGGGWTLDMPAGVSRIAAGAADRWGNANVKVLTL